MKYRFSICLVFSRRRGAVDLVHISAWFYNVRAAAADSTVKRKHTLTERKKEKRTEEGEEKYCRKER